MIKRKKHALDFRREFPHLAAAPIVEAVIHWRAQSQRNWDRDELSRELAARLPDYPEQKEQHHLLLGLEAQLDTDAEPKASRQGGWSGFRQMTSDGLNIAQFKRDGFVFSRLRPYQNWDEFKKEASRLWRIFVELASPSEVSRLGVRFINRIPIGADRELNEYLVDPPSRPLDLPLQGFLYQSTLDVPEHHFGVNIVKTLQGGDPGDSAAAALILDIDVFTGRPSSCCEEAMDELLPKMRWLKNAVFFELITPKAIESFKA